MESMRKLADDIQKAAMRFNGAVWSDHVERANKNLLMLEKMIVEAREQMEKV